MNSFKFLQVALFAFAATLTVLPTPPAGADELPPLETVAYVDLSKYVGQWFEISSIPAFFSRGCVASTATYTALEDGNVGVVNECRKNSFDGEISRAEGVATVEDKVTNAKLKVNFKWNPFSGTYWIIDLDPDYQWAVVGHPSRDYLWVLSRTAKMDAQLYQQILQRIEQKHYDVSKIQITPQP